MIAEYLPLLALLFLATGDGTGGKGAGKKTSGKGPRWRELEANAQAAGVDDDWVRFLKAWAYHESRGKPDSLNDSEKARKGAGRLYDNQRETLGACPWGRAAYSYGAGGWYQLLPVSAVWAFRGTPALCKINPRRTVFDPWESTLEAIAYAKRSMQRASFKERPIWRILNRATAAPGLMDERPGDAQYERAKQADDAFAKALDRLGIPASFANQRVTPLPPGWSAYKLWQAKGAVA